ncbi:hypothetical protein [Methanobacterium sp.]|uniref:hypothetical protein n=1 Tax=Methanobacterium sp. TaxID=2164 RepID=UPI003C720341
MATIGLDKHIDFSEEYFDIFEILSNAYEQLKENNEVNENIVKYMEGRMLYILQFKHLTPNEELIREQLINAIKSLIDLHYMFSNSNGDKIDIDKVNIIECNLKTNKSKSRALIEVISEFTYEYCNEMGESGVPLTVIINEMEKRHKMSKEAVESILSKLKSSGTVFEPQRDHLKVV